LFYLSILIILESNLARQEILPCSCACYFYFCPALHSWAWLSVGPESPDPRNIVMYGLHGQDNIYPTSVAIIYYHANVYMALIMNPMNLQLYKCYTEQLCKKRCVKKRCEKKGCEPICCLAINEGLEKQQLYIEYIISLIDKYTQKLIDYGTTAPPDVIAATNILLQNLIQQQQNLNTIHAATLSKICSC
jgi:hypothetical protein